MTKGAHATKPTRKEPAVPPKLRPQGAMPPTWTFHRHPWYWLIRHWLLKRFRRKLTCPACGAVGTWKPYGYWWKDRSVKRWLCKWCGFYDGVDGRCWAKIEPGKGCWVLEADWTPRSFTPQELAEKRRYNPWNG